MAFSRKAFSEIILVLLLAHTLTLAFNIHPVSGSGTVYIRADGSIDPPTAPIYNADNTTYTLTGNITADADGIVIERDNIVLNGAGYTLRGFGTCGVNLSGRTNVTIQNVHIGSWFTYGIFLSSSSNSTIYRNTLDNDNVGISVRASSNNNIFQNNMTGNEAFGLTLVSSSNNSISGNNATNNSCGMLIQYSSGGNVISGNKVVSNTFGIDLDWSSGDKFTGNTMTNNEWNFGLYEWWLTGCVNDVDTSNTVNGKPIYYYVNKQDMTVPLDAGYVALVNCARIVIHDLNLTHNMQGILLYDTVNSTITNTNVADNWMYGIVLWGSSGLGSTGNTLFGNNVTANSWGGIDLSGYSNTISGNNVTGNGYGITCSSLCSGSEVYHNNFKGNGRQDRGGWGVTWDSGYPSGGNYWSDYMGIDANSDGIGDTPYVIDENNADRYPLMSPWASSGFNGTVYIRADGSVDPPEAPISTSDNVTYTLTGSITSDADGIAVEKDDILVNGSGFAVEGIGGSKGIDLSGRNNVRINNMKIRAFSFGIYLDSSSNITVSGNIITNNFAGIELYNSANNNIAGNSIEENSHRGVRFYYSSNNSMNGNTFSGCGLVVIFSYKNDVKNNTVNGKPLVYLEDIVGYDVGEAGQVVLVRCDNVLVENLDLSEASVGVQLEETNNSIVTLNNMKANSYNGILLYNSCNNNSINRNNITDSLDGIELYSSFENQIVGNNITTNSRYGIVLSSTSHNEIYHNNFINNPSQAYCLQSIDVWDDGYPSGGNYWSDYNGTDACCGVCQNVTGSDGIGDGSYIIDANNIDNYPLMSQSSTSNFTVYLPGIGPVNVDVMSNSTVGNVQIGEAARSLSFNVSGPTGTSGFCRIVLPNIVIESLWGSNYTVLINGEPCLFTSASDSENTYIFISYTHSEHQVVIIPEFPSFLVLALITATILAAKIYKRRKAVGPDEDVSSLHWLEVEK